ncbi:hypothetical protein QNI19_29950 [Cytophagaceae bacterium DM2B3-1]|uniref:Phosphate transport system regulatory protein PhoU n=1 Tax=Xanthocytophaga flava TaxID=3048013 RepID=A0ABT7CX62_9BACT|nr:hypothetical protein [Xanthocytophaga flavus]MDJ1497199.1 hypothetical protein [Xanthocytophaga flavus]
MAYSRDLILRVLEQIRDMLARVVGLVEEGRIEQALAQSNAIAQKVTGKGLDELLELDLQAIAQLIVEGSEKDQLKQLEYLSDMLFVYASRITSDSVKKDKALTLSASLLEYIVDKQSTVLDMTLSFKMNKIKGYREQGR